MLPMCHSIAMIRVKGLSLLILIGIPGLLAYPAQLPNYLVPLDTSQTTTLRVFCISDPSHEVSFLPDSKCSSSCGYYDNQNSCCKVFQQGETIKCFLSSKKDYDSKLKSLMFDTAYITPQENIQIISDEEKSVLTCLEDTKHKQISHLSDSGFYLKYAYLYEGIAREFGTFSTLKSVHLPANQETRTCNQTNYKWEGDYIGEKTIIKIGLMVIGIVVIVLVIVMSIIVEKARRQALARDNEAGVPEVVVTTDPPPRPGKPYTALLPTATPDRCQSTGCMPLKTVSITTSWYDRRDYGPPDVNDVHPDQGTYHSSPFPLLKRHNTHQQQDYQALTDRALLFSRVFEADFTGP